MVEKKFLAYITLEHKIPIFSHGFTSFRDFQQIEIFSLRWMQADQNVINLPYTLSVHLQ